MCLIAPSLARLFDASVRLSLAGCFPAEPASVSPHLATMPRSDWELNAIVISVSTRCVQARVYVDSTIHQQQGANGLSGLLIGKRSALDGWDLVLVGGRQTALAAFRFSCRTPAMRPMQHNRRGGKNAAATSSPTRATEPSGKALSAWRWYCL